MTLEDLLDALGETAEITSAPAEADVVLEYRGKALRPAHADYDDETETL